MTMTLTVSNRCLIIGYLHLMFFLSAVTSPRAPAYGASLMYSRWVK